MPPRAMTWEEKLVALNALGECELRLRKPGDWYVLHRGVGIADGQFESGGGGDGKTPEAAVEDLWRQSTDELPEGRALLVRATSRYVRWNGFMWAEVERPVWRRAVRS